jgi:regulator of sigma E protease
LNLAYDILSAIFAFMVVIGPAIFFHELGHFLFAKRYGVKVYAFSLGFGPKIFSFERGGTEYRLSWIPLGGYVKMAGEDPAEPAQGVADEFSAKPVWQRAVIIAAGPAANLILGFLLCIFIYLMGVDNERFQTRVGYIEENSPVAGVLALGDEIRAIDGKPVTRWYDVDYFVREADGRPIQIRYARGGVETEMTVQPVDIVIQPEFDWVTTFLIRTEDAVIGRGTLGIHPWVEPVIGNVNKEGPAMVAGIQSGDTVIAVNDTPCVQWRDVATTVRRAGEQTIAIRYRRGDTELVTRVTPKIFYQQLTNGSMDSYSAIGISPQMKPSPQGPVHATVSAVFMTLRMGRIIFYTLAKLIAGELSPKLLAGPLGIAQGSGSAFRDGGLLQLVYYLALISINLGVVNLVPFPLLDGGWLFIFLLYELVARKPMAPKVQERLMQAGMAALLVLILFITFNDIKRMLGTQTIDEIMNTKAEGKK